MDVALLLDFQHSNNLCLTQLHFSSEMLSHSDRIETLESICWIDLQRPPYELIYEYLYMKQHEELSSLFNSREENSVDLLSISGVSVYPESVYALLHGTTGRMVLVRLSASYNMPTIIHDWLNNIYADSALPAYHLKR